jgi:hypothetical protein
VRFVVGFVRFWWVFIIGDDWRIAAGVGLALALGAALVAVTGLSDAMISLISGAAILTAVIATIVGPTIRKHATE